MIQEKLKVSVCSFSYKRGIPFDASGNGGGFVFDCRAINNPGQIEEYKQLTGKDEAVITFLEQESDIEEFLGHAYVIISKSVEKYILRGFKSLMVCFGCTGGRHRSVYSAEKIAALLSKDFDIDVEIIHFEQAAW